MIFENVRLLAEIVDEFTAPSSLPQTLILLIDCLVERDSGGTVDQTFLPNAHITLDIRQMVFRSKNFSYRLLKYVVVIVVMRCHRRRRRLMSYVCIILYTANRNLVSREIAFLHILLAVLAQVNFADDECRVFVVIEARPLERLHLSLLLIRHGGK